MQAERGEGHGGAASEGEPERLGDLQDVGVPVDVVEDVDLLAVLGSLDDGQEIVLAPGQERGRNADVVHGVVDAVEADTRSTSRPPGSA